MPSTRSLRCPEFFTLGTWQKTSPTCIYAQTNVKPFAPGFPKTIQQLSQAEVPQKNKQNMYKMLEMTDIT